MTVLEWIGLAVLVLLLAHALGRWIEAGMGDRDDEP